MSCNHGGPEQDAAVAQQAFAQGDLPHALHHIVGALTTDPMRPEWLALMDAILRRAPDPLALVAPQDGRTDFGTASARAYAFAIRGQWDEALPLVAQVVSVRPDVPYLAWAEQWIRVPGVAQLPVDLLGPRFVGKLLDGLPRAQRKDDPCLANLRHAAAIAAVLREARPNEGFFWYASSAFARRMGSFAEAVQFAQQGLRVEPKFVTAIGYACALRDAGQTDAAIRAFHEARRFDPQDVSTFLDVGDMLLDAKRYPEAVENYQQVLSRQPNHPWALASAHWARYQQTQSAQEKAALVALRDRFPFEPRVRQFADRLEPVVPFHNFIPAPGDATANALRDVVEMLRQHPERGPGGNVNLEVTHPESPSVLVAFRMETAHVQPPPTVTVKVKQIQTPDPRAPKGQVEFVAWTYEGTEARPTIGPPDARLADAVAAIAASPFNMDAWEPQAEALARQLEPGWIPSLVAVMVHPPAKKLEVSAFFWVQRVQIAAALVIARIGQGWEGSPRKKALFALALGPVDWTASAAVLALGRLAKGDPAIRRDVEQTFSWLETQIPQGSFTCFEYPLVCAWLAMGPHDDAARRRLSGKRAAIEHGWGSDVDERYEGLTLEQYAEFCVKRDLIVARQAQAHGFGGAAAAAATKGGGAWPELQRLCQEYGVTPKTYIEGIGHVPGADSAAVYEWDHLINNDLEMQRRFQAAKRRFELKSQGIDPDSEEGRVAQRIQAGLPMDLEAEKRKAAAAAQQMAAGGGGDPDPVVFPGQRLAKLSDYVGMMRHMQTGDMMGALARYGLDMGSYAQVAQAWGIKLAADPVLTAKFTKMMTGG